MNEKQEKVVEEIEEEVQKVSFIEKDNLLIENDIGYKVLPINKFAAEIFKNLPEYDKNHIVCPINLFASFAMLYIGANSYSFYELRKFLQLDNWQHFSDDTVLKTIQSVLQVTAYERFKLRPSYDWFNVFRILIDIRADYSDKFKNDTKRYFNVDIDRIDFERDSDLIADQFTELMQMEVDPDIHPFNTNIDRRTQIVILSAVRFKSKWDIQFPSNDIKDEYFYNKDDKRTTVKMMEILHRSWGYSFIIEWDAHIVEIPLTSNSMTFVIILPKMRNGLDKVWDNLSYESLSEAIKCLHSSRCDIFLPKFKLECDYDFVKIYNKLKIFNTSEELQEIGGKHPIKPNNVLHKVVFEINENGFYPAKPDLINRCIPRLIRADHPFLFLVIDMRTCAWMFIGKVNSL